MDFTKVTTWIKDNPITAAGIGIAAVGMIAFFATGFSSTNEQVKKIVRQISTRKAAKRISPVKLK